MPDAAEEVRLLRRRGIGLEPDAKAGSTSALLPSRSMRNEALAMASPRRHWPRRLTFWAATATTSSRSPAPSQTMRFLPPRLRVARMSSEGPVAVGAAPRRRRNMTVAKPMRTMAPTAMMTRPRPRPLPPPVRRPLGAVFDGAAVRGGRGLPVSGAAVGLLVAGVAAASSAVPAVAVSVLVSVWVSVLVAVPEAAPTGAVGVATVSLAAGAVAAGAFAAVLAAVPTVAPTGAAAAVVGAVAAAGVRWIQKWTPSSAWTARAPGSSASALA